MPGHYEQEAIKAASSALALTPDPADRCRAQLTLGKARLALYYLHLGPAAGSDAWPQPDSLQVPVAAATSGGAQVSGRSQVMSDFVQHAS